MIYFATLARTRIYAFEPVPAAADWLTECLHRQTGWRARVIRKGLDRAPGRRDFLLAGPDSGATPWTTLHTEWYRDKRFDVASFEVDTLDRSLDEFGEPRCRLWKLDVEGAELAALEGAREHIGQGRVDAIWIELHPANVDAVNTMLRTCGYRPYRIRTNGTPLALNDAALRKFAHSVVYTANH